MRLVSLLIVLSFVMFTALPVRAQTASTWADTDFASVRLISAQNGTAGGTELLLGLEFRLAEGWKIYWRSPGDAGFPPRLDW